MNIIHTIQKLFGLGKRLDMSDCLKKARRFDVTPYEAYATVAIFNRRNSVGLFDKNKILENKIDFNKLVFKLEKNNLVTSSGNFSSYYGDLTRTSKLINEGYRARIILLNEEEYMDFIDIDKNIFNTIERNIITIPYAFLEKGEAVVLDFFDVFDSLKINTEYVRCHNTRIKFENDKEKIYPPLGQKQTKVELDEMAMEAGKYKEKDGSTGKLDKPLSENYGSSICGPSKFEGIEGEITTNDNYPYYPIFFYSLGESDSGQEQS